MSAAPVYRWQPSTAEIAARAGIPVDAVIRFDHNTSPSRPPWASDVAAAAGQRINEYPAADYTPLREAIAEYHGVDRDQVVPGAGADELILLTAKAFLEPGDRAAAGGAVRTQHAARIRQPASRGQLKNPGRRQRADPSALAALPQSPSTSEYEGFRAPCHRGASTRMA